MNFTDFYMKERVETFYHGSQMKFDTFIMDKVGTGDGLNKFGFGLYFAESEELAKYYAGENKNKGAFLYEVQVKELENFHNWDEQTPDDIYSNVISSLERLGKDSDVEEIKQDMEDYGDKWSIDSLYQWLTVVLGSQKATSAFLYKNGLSGVIADDLHDRGKIFVAYSDSIVRIIDVTKIL